MNRMLPLGIAVAGMLMLTLPQPIFADNQVGVLNHFVTLPTGLDAEGLAISGGAFYVGTIGFTATDGSILAYNQSGVLERTFTVPGMPVVGQVAVRQHNLFAVVCTSFSPTGTGAVVKVDLSTGVVTTVATDPTCPNGLAIDGHGNMFITNILAGTISEVTPSGTISTFAGGPLLAVGGSLGAGPNDIAFDKHTDALYVTNIGLNTIVKIQILDNGSAGAMSVFSSGVPGGDGLAFDQIGNLYVASPFSNAIYIVSPDGSTASLLSLNTSAESLDTPSNVAFLGHYLYITNLGLSSTSGKISFAFTQFPGVGPD